MSQKNILRSFFLWTRVFHLFSFRVSICNPKKNTHNGNSFINFKKCKVQIKKSTNFFFYLDHILSVFSYRYRLLRTLANQKDPRGHYHTSIQCSVNVCWMHGDYSG